MPACCLLLTQLHIVTYCTELSTRHAHLTHHCIIVMTRGWKENRLSNILLVSTYQHSYANECKHLQSTPWMIRKYIDASTLTLTRSYPFAFVLTYQTRTLKHKYARLRVDRLLTKRKKKRRKGEDPRNRDNSCAALTHECFIT